MRAVDHFNNLGIEALALIFVLEKTTPMPLSKLMFILPIIAHKEMLYNLANKNVKVLSFENYLIEKISYFSNFNDRYYDNMVGTINALQLLFELELIKFDDKKISLKTSIKYQKSMGERTKKIYKAAENISKLLEVQTNILHLNTRVEL